MTDTTTLLKAASPPEPAAQDLEIVPVRGYGRWIAAAASILALVGLIGSLAKNDNLHWDVVATYLFADLIFDGLATTLWLTAAAMALGLGLGTLVAVMRLSTSPVLHGLATAFVWVFRGTPLLVQIIFWGYAAALYK
ncbi:ABC transporter permease subunit, partial [Streptomyces sp. NPDC057674]